MSAGIGLLAVAVNLLTLLSLLAGGAHLVMKIGSWTGEQSSTVKRIGVQADRNAKQLNEHEERISRIEGVCEERGKMKR